LDGSELWGQQDPQQNLIGCNPHFTGVRGDSVGFAVELQRIIPDESNPMDGRLVGTMADEEGCGCPVVVDIPDFRQHVSRLEGPVAAKLQIAAFAHDIQLFDTHESYASGMRKSLNASSADAPTFAVESFIPSGTFRPDGGVIEPPIAEAVFSGQILSVSRRRNTIGGHEFYALSVKTLGGELDVVLPTEATLSEPVVGGVIFGSFWLSGRLISPLPAPPTAAELQAIAAPLNAPRKAKPWWKFW
jgi:hypothetical protein